MLQEQLRWRAQHLPHVRGQGRWNKIGYDHILPNQPGNQQREENLWSGIRTGSSNCLETYLNQEGIQAHTGRDNLLSSWTLAANLYFPFRGAAGRRLLADFLKRAVDPSISGVDAIEFEWEHSAAGMKPPALLGETGGGRGSGQTSPDVAFEVRVGQEGRGVVLTEVKFTEHNFYACSVRRPLSPSQRHASCDSLAALASNPQGLCANHTVKGRRYWDHLAPVFDWQAGLRWCPAATAGYQLFRQQALAEGLAQGSGYALVVSSLAYHAGNQSLIRSLRRTGVGDMRTDWGPLYRGKAKFVAFTHQSWVQSVRTAANRPAWCTDWLQYVHDRYGM